MASLAHTVAKRGSRFIAALPAFLLILLFIFPSASFARQFAKQPVRTIDGFVTKVSDGDTVNAVDPSGTKLKVRLYGIDAPETEKSNKKTGRVSKPGQPYGEAAWKALRGKVYGQNVKLDVIAVDRYKRLVCLVWLGGRNINKEMVAEGYGWAYRDYLDTPYASEFIGAEAQARASRQGLWRENNPQPPWEFRKLLKAQRAHPTSRELASAKR